MTERSAARTNEWLEQTNKGWSSRSRSERDHEHGMEMEMQLLSAGQAAAA